MNDNCESFRQMQAAMERASLKSKLLQSMGQSIEAAISGRLDDMELCHPEIIGKMLELHLLLMYEINPSLEPKPEPTPEPVQEPQPAPNPELEAAT